MIEGIEELTLPGQEILPLTPLRERAMEIVDRDANGRASMPFDRDHEFVGKGRLPGGSPPVNSYSDRMW